LDGAASGQVELTSLNRAKRKPTASVTSFEYLLRGKVLHHRYCAEANQEAQTMFGLASRVAGALAGKRQPGVGSVV